MRDWMVGGGEAIPVWEWGKRPCGRVNSGEAETLSRELVLLGLMGAADSVHRQSHD